MKGKLNTIEEQNSNRRTCTEEQINHITATELNNAHSWWLRKERMTTKAIHGRNNDIS